MADIELPGTFINLLLKQIGKLLKIKYLPPKNNKLLAKKIFEAIAAKAEKYDSKILREIIKNLDKMIKPAISYLEILATVIKPIFSLIPPQYLIPILAVILLAFLMYLFVYPMFFLGLFLSYNLEEIIKVPFTNQSKRDLSFISPETIRDQYIIEKTENKVIRATLFQFMSLSYNLQNDFLFESDIPDFYEVFARVYRFLPVEQRNIETILKMIDEDEPGPVFDLLNLDTKETLEDMIKTEYVFKATFYSGKRRIFPPILHRIVNAFKGLKESLEKAQREGKLGGLDWKLWLVSPILAYWKLAFPKKWKWK